MYFRVAERAAFWSGASVAICLSVFCLARGIYLAVLGYARGALFNVGMGFLALATVQFVWATLRASERLAMVLQRRAHVTPELWRALSITAFLIGWVPMTWMLALVVMAMRNHEPFVATGLATFVLAFTAVAAVAAFPGRLIADHSDADARSGSSIALVAVFFLRLQPLVWPAIVSAVTLIIGSQSQEDSVPAWHTIGRWPTLLAILGAALVPAAIYLWAQGLGAIASRLQVAAKKRHIRSKPA